MTLVRRATARFRSVGRTPAPPVRLGVAAALDVAAVVVFVAVGRRNHHDDPGLAGVFATAAPFLLALAAGWLVARAWYAPMSLRTGAVVWVVTVAGGMLLRNVVFDRGTAMSFVVVATLFTGACLLGWRVVSRVFRPAW